MAAIGIQARRYGHYDLGGKVMQALGGDGEEERRLTVCRIVWFWVRDMQKCIAADARQR
jgi:hypothetical protein